MKFVICYGSEIWGYRLHMKKAVNIQIKIKLRSFKSSEHINEKKDGSYRGFGYLSLFSDPLDLAKWIKREIL